MYLRVVKLLLSFACVFLVSTSAANALIWENIGGERVLKTGPGGEVVQKYTASEWQTQVEQDEAIRDCLDLDTNNCAEILEETKPPTPPPLEGFEPDISYTPYEKQLMNQELAENAESVVDDAREAGDTLPEDVAGPMDAMSEAGGMLDLGLASTVLGLVALGPASFYLGVEIGNGLDQLFGFEEFNITGEESKVEEHSGCTTEHRAKQEINDTSDGGESFVLPEGTYENCHPPGGGAIIRTFESENTVEEAYKKVEEKNEGYILLRHTQTFTTINEHGTNIYNHKPNFVRTKYTYTWSEPENERCNTEKSVEEFLEEGIVESYGCYPVGVPIAQPITKAQEEALEKAALEHGKKWPTKSGYIPNGGGAFIPKPAATPLSPTTPNPIKEQVVKKITEIAPARKWITEHSPHTVKEVTKSKEENEELEIPEPAPNEKATEYKTRVEEVGFTDVTVSTVPEDATNPDVGPEGVASVSPSPGTEAQPSTHVTVEANPSDAPAPGEPSTGIGGPTLPGIKLPNFGVLCKGFPFGVPCWLIETIEGWSASAVAPEWGIENLEIDGHHITAKFDLAKLEPIMEKVRPAMILFATIGLVLLFYSFAKGGGPPSGGSADTVVSEDSNSTTYLDSDGNEYTVS
jgi:hypothetical protein